MTQSLFRSARSTVLLSMQAALAACCLFSGSALLSSTALAQQDDTFNRLNRLERELETLNRAVYKGDKLPATASGVAGGDNGFQANLDVRLSDLEKQIRDLTGKIEKLEFDNQQLTERLTRAQSDTELRLGDLEKRSGVSPAIGGDAGNTGAASAASGNTSYSGTLAADEMGAVPPMPNSTSSVSTTPSSTNPMTEPSQRATITDPNAPAPSDSPTQQQLGTLREAPGGVMIAPTSGEPASLYENAFSQLKGGNYGVAQRDFNSFLKTYPQHPLAPNATYWLGETYYAQGKYDQASRIFAESYKNYPKGPKAADSLLKLGMSLGGSGKSKEACMSLKQLKKEYTAAQSTAVRRADQEMSRLGCTA